MSVGKHAVGRRPLGKLALLLALAMVVSAFAVAPLAGAGDKSDVCHVEGTGDYHLINISDAAIDKHIAHGDAKPGDFFTNNSVFGADCQPTSLPVTVLDLTDGWDLAGSGTGTVAYWGPDSNGHLHVTFSLAGASANHTYTVGAHFDGLTALAFANSNTTYGSFGTAGWWLTDSEPITRDGITDGPLSAGDFGFLTTDGSGDGSVAFDMAPGSGTHSIQFTVRIGVCDLGGDTSGCGVVYRTGEPFLQNFAVITIP